MLKKYFLPLSAVIILCASCAVSNQNYDPGKKYSRQELQKDYSLLRNILQEKHPALYWYTPKDSMNYYFDSLDNNIADSMTELQFGWKVLAPLIQKIHCGHTSFTMSKQWNEYLRDKGIPSFPLFLKILGDTMVVTGNLNRKDSVIKKGTIITSINSLSTHQLMQNIFQYLPQDGYADNVNYIRVSGNFPYYHRNVYGIYKNYRVGYIDSLGAEKTTLLPMFTPIIDSTHKKNKDLEINKIPGREIRKDRKEYARSLTIDSNLNTATITLNTFSNGHGRHLRSFIKQSFKKIKQQQIQNVIVDLRGNGGGDINMSVLLTKYLRTTPFKVADTAYAIAKSFNPYSRYVKNSFFDNIGLFFVTKKEKDGKYHFGYWENHWFYPKTNNHFDGKVYVLIGGLSFSASTLFCNSVKGQPNITIAGEDAGGGWYGNSGLLIPDITLPVTKLRVRLPFFKIVQYNHADKKGLGVAPDVYIKPSVQDVRNNIDIKMVTVKEMIKENSGANE